MSLSSVSINRPVLAIVMSIVIVVFGIISFTFLGVREYPAIDPAVITVSTSYTGANSDVIESQITEPLEESINGIAGIKSITSTSREGSSSITVEFNLEVPLEEAANDVRDRVSRAMRNLPPDADPPIVTKADANQNPIVMINLRSDTRNLLDLTEAGINIFKERLQTIPGVSEVRIWGEKRYSMRLWMNPALMAAYVITPQDVRLALQRENVELPTGRIEGDATELTVRTTGRMSTVEDFNNMIIRESGGRIIRMRDIGEALLGPENERSILKRDGIPMIAIVIVPQPGSNNIAIADEVNRRLEQIQRTLPADLRVNIFHDATKYIRRSIAEVEETIFIAFTLVVIIIFLFLRDWRATVIPVLAIPISLIGSFFIMYVMGFSINILTLLGIVLAIGLVVDDAIVVLENIYSKIEDGLPPIEAGKEGAKEIFFAVISTTVVLIAVFMPIVFLQGLTGRLFREFGFVVAGSVAISAFVALTLTSMLSTRLLRHENKHSRFYQWSEPFFIRLNAMYGSSLDSFMNRRSLSLVVMGLAVAVIIGLGSLLKSELAPLEDRSRLRISATAPEGATFEYMSEYMESMLTTVRASVPELEAALTLTGMGGPNSGFLNVSLVPPQERRRTQQEISDALAVQIRPMTVARAFVSQDQTIGSSRRGGLPVQFVIQAPNFDKLKEVLPRFLAEAEQDPTFQVVDVNLKFNKPELRVDIHRERARVLGLSVLDIAQTLQLAFSGQRFGFFVRDGKQYQVIGQFAREHRDKPLDLKSLFVRNNRGELIQMDNVVTLTEESNPPQRYRFNRYLSATVSAGLARGKTLGEGIEAMDAVAKRVLDDSFSTALDGASRDFSESSSSLQFSFMFALVLIYLVLAAQFESFRDPFTILLTVPLALAGAVLSLWVFGQTLNIFSQIGIIMLIGLVTKNGILIVEFANQRKENGFETMDAVKDAASQRFRPILMTSLSTILGSLPIALALGEGAESRMSMGIAVVGGLFLATFLTLYVIPAIYSYVSRDLSAQEQTSHKEASAH
ncbi:MAG: efflux RND transporter permease subunit [Bacteroidetes bacterium]|nr:efflux RND transporter permease subunit [Bacteroidota bacterium]